MHDYDAARRAALQALAGFLAGSPLLRGQLDPLRDHSRVPGIGEMETAFDFEGVAFARVPRAAYNYTAYGSETEFTLRRNRQAFDWVTLRAGGVASGQPRTATEVLGTKMAFPIMISPSAAQAALHPEGEPAMYQGATAASETPMIISHVASFPVDKIAAAAKGPLWFQLYPRPEMDANRKTLEDAQAAGCKAIVVTIDQQASYFERALHDRNLAAAPPRRTSARGAPSNPYGLTETRLWYEWKMFDELRPMVKVPMIAKGVLTAEDAKLCLEHGLDGVYVSNHGGRSLDYAPSSLEALPEVVDAVGGRVPVLFDSGVRRGADVLKALALGAKAVCLGRVPRWGLAAYGAPGVRRILEIVQAELAQAMAAAGVMDVASIDRAVARTDFP
jgi:isopentenyl diphosphate isomerase/L-lactate dehydrogenase-like FMN-dependent dehydrogenase